MKILFLILACFISINASAQGIQLQVADKMLCDGQSGSSIKTAILNASGAGDYTIVDAVPGKKIRVLSITSSYAAFVRFESGTGGTALTGVMGVSVFPDWMCGYTGCFETNTGELLNLEVTSGNMLGFLTYVLCE